MFQAWGEAYPGAYQVQSWDPALCNAVDGACLIPLGVVIQVGVKPEGGVHIAEIL